MTALPLLSCLAIVTYIPSISLWLPNQFKQESPPC
jgi:TRAP-type C4-dicarboxylate transport system permease large subunit